MTQWPEKSFSMSFAQALAWKKSGLMLMSNIWWMQHWGAGISHSYSERTNESELWLYIDEPSFCICIHIFKCEGSLESSGIVLRADTPFSNIGCPSFSVRLKSVIEF
ncbi:hypothetical protein ACFE04_006416 [Oxalis oulophora]